MTYASYSKSTATGGGTGQSEIYYAEYHDAYLYSWAPTAGPLGGPRPVLVRFHGGGGTNVPIAETARKTPLSNQFTALLPDYFTDRGWGIVNVEYGNGGPPGLDQALAPYSTGFGLVSLACRALSFIKDNASDASLWGFEIDPLKVVPWGNSFGGWLASMTQYVPSDWLDEIVPLLAPARDRWPYHSSPKCPAIYNNGGPASFPMIDPAVTVAADPGEEPPSNVTFSGQAATISFFDSGSRYVPSGWTQDPGGSPGGDPFGIAQVSARRKQSLSPAFMLNVGDSSSRVPSFLAYPALDVIGNEIIFNPATMPLTTPVANSTGPDDPFQGSVLAYTLSELGITYQAYSGSGTESWLTGPSSATVKEDLFSWLTNVIGITA